MLHVWNIYQHVPINDPNVYHTWSVWVCVCVWYGKWNWHGTKIVMKMESCPMMSSCQNNLDTTCGPLGGVQKTGWLDEIQYLGEEFQISRSITIYCKKNWGWTMKIAISWEISEVSINHIPNISGTSSHQSALGNRPSWMLQDRWLKCRVPAQWSANGLPSTSEWRERCAARWDSPVPLDPCLTIQ